MQVRLESRQILVTIHIPTKVYMYYVGVWIHLVIHLCVCVHVEMYVHVGVFDGQQMEAKG